MIQGYELDDANPASIHSCAAVLPAVFAAAEMVGPDKVDGETLLTAIIAGFEVGPRVGLCMNGNKMLGKGWHTPGLFGPFPAAVAAGRVLGLDSEQIFQALGIAGPAGGRHPRHAVRLDGQAHAVGQGGAERPVRGAAGGRRLHRHRGRIRGGVRRLLHYLHPEHATSSTCRS